MYKLLYTFVGIILIITGIRILYNPIILYGGYGVYIDFTEYKIPAVIIFITSGILILVMAYRSKYEDYICPKCEEVFTQKDVQSHKSCPTCNVALERLKGFYKHHPEP